MLVVAGGLSCPKACGLLVPHPGFEPASPASEGGFLTTEAPRKLPRVSFANQLSNSPPTHLCQLPEADHEAPVSKRMSCTVPSPEGMAVSPGLCSFWSLPFCARSELLINTCRFLNKGSISPAPAPPLAVPVPACPPPPAQAGNGWLGARPSLDPRVVMRGRTNAR